MTSMNIIVNTITVMVIIGYIALLGSSVYGFVLAYLDKFYRAVFLMVVFSAGFTLISQMILTSAVEIRENLYGDIKKCGD